MAINLNCVVSEEALDKRIDDANLRIQGWQRYEEVELPKKLKKQREHIKGFLISELRKKNPKHYSEVDNLGRYKNC